MSAERGTPELNGSGVIELLAREMTLDLHKIRDEIVDRAIKTGTAIRRKLITKGISFGFITSEADGSLRLSEVEGVDRDLVIRPWTQKGTISSLRTFTINATNLHHGMQASERFGLRLTGSFDFDRDGIDNELTEGDITAMVVFQASLNIPGKFFRLINDKDNEWQRGRSFSIIASAQAVIFLNWSLTTPCIPNQVYIISKAH